MRCRGAGGAAGCAADMGPVARLKTVLEDSGLFRPPYSIPGASRADSSGSGHLLEQEDPMGDSGSDAGASIHASFRPLHTTEHREQPPGVCAKSVSFSSSTPSTQLSWTAPTGSITSHTPPINPAPRVRVSHSRVVARARRCDCAHRTGRPDDRHIYAPWRPRARESDMAERLD